MLSKLQIWLAGAFALFAGIAIAMIKVYQAGADKKELEQAQKKEKLQNAYDEIDAGKPDVNESIGRLRDRNK